MQHVVRHLLNGCALKLTLACEEVPIDREHRVGDVPVIYGPEDRLLSKPASYPIRAPGMYWRRLTF